MVIDGIYICKVCSTGYVLRNHDRCPKCHNPQGSVRCPDCGEVIMEWDNFCSHCGADLRWVTFKCPHCGEEVVAHRRPGLNSTDSFRVSCPKCGHSFLRPDVHP